MTHAEMVALIRDGVPEAGGTWADLGAGGGNFTWALAERLGAPATLYALDRDPQAIRDLQRRAERSPAAAPIYPLLADFTQPLALPLLDGVLMANALHFQREPRTVLRQIAEALRPGGSLLLVEYDVTIPRSYVPCPVPWESLPTLLRGSGFSAPTRLGTRRSPSTGIAMYAALMRKTEMNLP